jgi:FkbM family methyltransferase
MSIVSYAQNFEDVMLWRALSSVRNGFYIDIGAQDPEVDSVSLAFYENGWRGLHIEPSEKYSAALKAARPDERVLQVAVAAEAGELAFYEFKNTGLSTGRSGIADSHVDQGHDCSQTVVKTLTLDNLFDEVKDRDVHWLKIDVEGMESEVLSGWRTSAVRPWIIVVESTLPGSQEETYQSWEPVLISKGYHHVYSDGVNRFYVSGKHTELKSAFKYPPNVFDEFSLSGKGSHSFCRVTNHQTYLANVNAATAAKEAYTCNTKLLQVKKDLESSLNQLSVSQTTVSELQRELEKVLSSRSWRLTSPVRQLADAIKNGLSRWHALFAKQILVSKSPWYWLDSLLRKTARVLLRYPRVRKTTLSVLKKFPWLYEKLSIRLRRYDASKTVFHSSLSTSQAVLTVRARMIYKRLTCNSQRPVK